MKTPIRSNKKTIKKRIHKASEQASHIIFDLRKVNSNSSEVAKELVDRFQDNTKLKKMVLIIDDEKVLEFSKK